jgi:cytosine permease
MLSSERPPRLRADRAHIHTPPLGELMAATLPSYIASAKPVPLSARQPWYKNTAPTYAGIFLWFVFWDSMAGNGLPQGGLWVALAGVVIGGFICHGAFYMVPGLLGMRTGLPLSVVGSSTFGAMGGLFMPGLLMGLLQFGWLAVNTYASTGKLLGVQAGTTTFNIVCILWAGLAAFMGLKGIQYVAKVATFLPLIPLVVLLLCLGKFGGSAFEFKPSAAVSTKDSVMAALMMIGAIVGFFATAGAAGVDFGMNNRDGKDVSKGGLAGIFFATVFTAGIAVLGVAGAQVQGALPSGDYTLTHGLEKTVSPAVWSAIAIGLALSAFPGACFSSFIAANSFKTVMPNVNPFLSVGIGTVISISLAITGVAGDLGAVFGLIGASFGPICGAMVADYYLSGKRWAGPRAGFNIPGWGAWLVGFFIGIMPNLHKTWPAVPDVPAAPVVAFIVGFAFYAILAKMGLEGERLPMPENTQEPSVPPASPAGAPY